MSFLRVSRHKHWIFSKGVKYVAGDVSPPVSRVSPIGRPINNADPIEQRVDLKTGLEKCL